jgi:glycosyltransferase involved in cell wall biosynthesis
MPKISVISIARDEKELNGLKEALSKQTYKDFEFVISTRGTIPEAWNDAISRAKGEFLVFTESDARPLSDNWLKEISEYLEKNTIIKGLEIRPSNLNMSNLVADAAIFKTMKFDENYPVGEDSELFARLHVTGIRIKWVNAFPVIHTPSISWKKTLSRSFRYGRLQMKIIYLHGRENMQDINTQNLNENQIHPVSNSIRIITGNVLFLLGLVFGSLYHMPTLIKRKIHERKHENQTKRFLGR